jgi:hypothetical protein
MAVKSIIDVEINDESFKRFNDLFNQYRQKLGETPAAVNAVNAEIKNSEAAYAGVVAAIFAQTETLKHAMTAQQDYNKETDKGAHSWNTIAKATKSAVSDIIAGTTALLRFASFGGALSGLLGAGTLFGLDKIGQGVGNARRSSQGVGASTGEQEAFNLSFGRYLDTDSLVSGLNGALTDPTKRLPLITLGASQADINSGNAVKTATDILPRLKQIADTTNPLFYQSAINTHQLGGLNITPETLKRLHALSPGEFQDALSQNSSYAKRLNVTDSDARAWQDFVVQLKLAGQEIENVLVKGLEPLTIPLKDLSKSFTDVVETFLKAAKDQGWIESISSGLEEFAKYIGDQHFKDDVKEFVADIGVLATDIKKTLQFIGVIPDKDKATATDPADTAVTHLPGIDITHGSRNPFTGKWSGTPSDKSSDGLDQWLDGIKNIESGGRANAVSSKGALGPYQLMPDTAASLGVGNPFDEKQSRAGARSLLQALLRQFNGDMDEALAAYNWGSGNVRRDITNHGDAWRNFLPDETKKYIGSVRVQVMNATGGNSIITSSQLPQ